MFCLFVWFFFLQRLFQICIYGSVMHIVSTFFLPNPPSLLFILPSFFLPCFLLSFLHSSFFLSFLSLFPFQCLSHFFYIPSPHTHFLFSLMVLSILLRCFSPSTSFLNSTKSILFLPVVFLYLPWVPILLI